MPIINVDDSIIIIFDYRKQTTKSRKILMKKLKLFASISFTMLLKLFRIFVSSKMFDILFYSSLFYFLIKYCTTIAIIAISLGFFASVLCDIQSNIESIKTFFEIPIDDNVNANDKNIEDVSEEK